MDDRIATEHEKYEVATAVSILSFDLSQANDRVPTLLRANTLDMLVAKRDELLAQIDQEVSMQGFYILPAWIDADWLATQLQTELGSYVAGGEYQGHKALLLVDPS